MIFVTDKGRLANNIFQYGHLYAWGREHGRTTMSMRFAYKYPDFQIAHTRHHHFLLYILAKYAAKLHLIPTVQFNIMNDPFLEQQKTMLNSKYVLATGWCVRFPDLFEKYKDEMLDGAVLIGFDVHQGFLFLIADGRDDTGVYYWDDSYVFEESDDDQNVYLLVKDFSELAVSKS